MGMLLSFAPPRAAKPRQKPRPGSSASIIIFPGIRYERLNALDRLGQMMAKPELHKPGQAPLR